MFWGTKKSLLLILALRTSLAFGERAPMSFAGGLIPIHRSNNERVVAVDGVPVPEGAHFYQFISGQVQFLDQSRAPLSLAGLSTPINGNFYEGPAPFPPLSDEDAARVGTHGTESRRPIADSPSREESARIADPLPSQQELPSYTPTNPPPAISLDLKGFTADGKAFACQATPVKLSELASPGLCKLALYTAGHCVLNPRTALGHVGFILRTPGFNGRVNIKGTPGWQTNRFAETFVPEAFIRDTKDMIEEQREALRRGEAISSTAVVPDGGLLFITAPCREFSEIKTVDFAPQNSDGMVQFGTYNWIQKRNRTVGNNRGTSRRLQFQNPEVDGELIRVIVPSSQGEEAFGIIGGDSGGGIFDNHGRLLGSTSGSSLDIPLDGAEGLDGKKDPRYAITKNLAGETLVPDHNVTFWGKGTAWAQDVIEKKMGKLKKANPDLAAPFFSRRNPTDTQPHAEPTRGNSQHPDIQRYENLQYFTGGRRERFDYPAGVFKDVPIGGTGKIILAYFGNRDREDLKAMASRNPLFEVRRYPFHSPEHQHAELFRTEALAIDGLGRKITRFTGDPMQALQSLMRGNEPVLLSRYLSAKKALRTPSSDEARTQEASLPRTEHAAPFLIPVPQHQGRSEADRFNASNLGPFIVQNCNSCHAQGRSASPFPNFVYNWNQWQGLINQHDPMALDMLRRFNSKVVHGEMLTNAGLSRTQGIGKAFSDFIAMQSPPANPELAQGLKKMGSKDAVSMADPKKLQEYLGVLKNANIPDHALKWELLDFDAIYDSIGNQPWSWAAARGESGLGGQRPVGRAPAIPPRADLFENINGVWKWREPFSSGFSVDNNTSGLEKFTLVKFPRDRNGQIIKGARGTEKKIRAVNRAFSEEIAHRGGESFDDLDSIWASFPEGTKVFEVFYSQIDGKLVPVDILVREKRITPDGGKVVWVPDALRQDSSPEKIKNWVMGQSGWQENPHLRAIFNAVSRAERDGVVSTLGADRSGGRPFNVAGQFTNQIPASKSVLPEGVDEKVLARMYQELPMESAAGVQSWQLEPRQMFKNSHRGIAVNVQTCTNCHTSAGEAFRDVFTYAGLARGGVSQYGNMQGYDGVLSAPWFSAQALAQYGTKITTQMRPEWAKFFDDYNPTLHPKERFRRTERFNVSDHPLRSRR